jgi:hypothetical protein
VASWFAASPNAAIPPAPYLPGLSARDRLHHGEPQAQIIGQKNGRVFGKTTAVSVSGPLRRKVRLSPLQTRD